jgi:hypothetical protein
MPLPIEIMQYYHEVMIYCYGIIQQMYDREYGRKKLVSKHFMMNVSEKKED